MYHRNIANNRQNRCLPTQAGILTTTALDHIGHLHDKRMTTQETGLIIPRKVGHTF